MLVYGFYYDLKKLNFTKKKLKMSYKEKIHHRIKY